MGIDAQYQSVAPGANAPNIPWFHDIFSAFSLSLMCVQKPLCIDFYVSFPLFVGNLSKDERGSF